jgi:tetraacyldisaccharide 4'-kinase
MRPPEFWQNPPHQPGLTARLLWPLAALTAWATARRVRQPGQAAGVPVICLGNLTVGGAGKTPATIAIADLLIAQGLVVHIVSRGYGGRLSGPVRVDERTHTSADVGDEPLLLAAFAPTWVARDRAAGVRAAVASGARAILLDDGFQNPSVVKDLSLVVVDAEVGFGNGRCLPAGPLREPVAAGLKRAQGIILIGPEPARTAFRAVWQPGLPVFEAVLEPLATGMPWAGLRAVAFAGIGRPEKFFTTLRGLGADVVATVPLDDHQPLTSALMQRLAAQAKAAGARLVTTEKDAVRLPVAWRAEVLTLPVRLRFLADQGVMAKVVAAAND